MSRSLNHLRHGLLLSLAVGLVGCSSAGNETPPMAMPQAAQKPSKSSTKSNADLRKTQAATSLDALRRGEAAITPRESPLKDVYFDFDRYDLTTIARATLKANADWLRKNPGVRVEIEGHCDERGTAEYNLALGAKRAQAAKDYLLTLGVAPDRLSTISYGEEVPVCRENNDACWQRNRRDRFVALTPKPGV